MMFSKAAITFDRVLPSEIVHNAQKSGWWAESWTCLSTFHVHFMTSFTVRKMNYIGFSAIQNEIVSEGQTSLR